MTPIIQPAGGMQIAKDQPLSLRQGQVFRGRIHKLFQDQMAEVHIGKQKMLAKLEVPLKAGDAHYFQVVGVKEGLHVKVLTSALAKTSAGQTSQLMNSLKLPNSDEMDAILKVMVEGRLTLSRNQLIEADQWLKKLPAGIGITEGIAAIQKMSELKLPFTGRIFQAVISGQDAQGLNKLLDAFSKTLQTDESVTAERRTSILKLLEQMSTPFSKELGGIILGKIAAQLLSPVDSSDGSQEALLALLKEAGLAAKDATLSNWVSRQAADQTPAPMNAMTIGQLLEQVKVPESGQAIYQQLIDSVQENRLLADDARSQILGMINKAIQSSSSTSESAFKQLSMEILKAFADSSATHPFQMDSKQLSSKDHLLSILTSLSGTAVDVNMLDKLAQLANRVSDQAVQQIVSAAESTLQSGITHSAIAQAMKQLISDIGFSYEAKLAAPGSDYGQISNSLKPQLLALLQDPAISSQVKDAADAILERLNGLQLLSGENGPEHQLLMQLPLNFLGKRMDAAIQWNGRMKENGKIDSDYARVMFFLELSALKETVIDMQVQNRVITINIYNEHEGLQPFAEPFKEALKNGLGSLNYQLSGVFLKSYQKMQMNKERGEMPDPAKGSVDVRI